MNAHPPCRMKELPSRYRAVTGVHGRLRGTTGTTGRSVAGPLAGELRIGTVIPCRSGMTSSLNRFGFPTTSDSAMNTTPWASHHGLWGFDEGEGGDGVGRVASGGEHEAVARGVVLREPDVGEAGGDKSAGRVALALERGLHGGPQFLEAPGQHAGDDGGQIGEMRVDRRRGECSGNSGWSPRQPSCGLPPAQHTPFPPAVLQHGLRGVGCTLTV
jgi:hypothetical protein